MSAGIPMKHGDYFVSTEPGLIDLEFVCTALAGTYWANTRPRTVVERSLKSSLCFGLYRKPEGRQVGFARVVTDGVTFSWLCDVVIAEGHRGIGTGQVPGVGRGRPPGYQGDHLLLGTRDAHGLYERYGFSRAEMMRRQPPNAVPNPPLTPS